MAKRKLKDEPLLERVKGELEEIKDELEKAGKGIDKLLKRSKPIEIDDLHDDLKLIKGHLEAIHPFQKFD